MTPARTYPERRDDVRLLVMDPSAAARRDGPAAGLRETRTRALPDFLAPGDLLVVNDAATLPASLRGHDGAGRPVEVRLLAARAGERFAAVLFGAGDWRVRTEDRPPPPELPVGASLRFGALGARIAGRDPIWPRIVELELDSHGDALWEALYREGRPVQYAYLAHELPLWAVQTVYASRPWSFEMPSAGRPLSWELLLALRRKGVRIVSLTHAAGLSSTGDPALDAALPLPERYDIPLATVRAVVETRARGGRIVAVGTTVVRALEGAAAQPQGLQPGAGETDLRITPAFRPRVVDGLLSGAHAAGESHFQLLAAFAGPALLAAAAAHAERAGFLTHELGDSMLVLPGALERPQRAPSPARRSAERASARCQPRGASSR
ncbi:MAG TPA: S-adenosylmethionine:tRNA ribosyltransferase-isomerase [Polyangia bacterium]|nr:S-adenosylmethionine:tRNA ribosyltransferase-isomerase [Polyangia bacterium]